MRLGERVQVGAAVRVHDALRPAGRAARVVDRDRVVLGLEPVLGLAVRRAGEELLVAAAEQRGRARPARPRDEVLERRVDDEQPGARVVEDVADLVRHQPRVDRDQHGARRGHAEVRLEQLGRVRREERDAVVLARCPRAWRPTASRRARSRNSAQVSRRSPSTTATRSGKRRARERSRNETGVSRVCTTRAGRPGGRPDRAAS